MKHVWTFHPKTKFLLSGGPRALQVPHYNRHLSENDPKKYALLPNSTQTAPPEPQEGFWPVWDGVQWSMIEDHRDDDRGYYLTKDRTDDRGEIIAVAGEALSFRDFGPLPDDLTVQAPNSEFDLWDSQKNAWVLDRDAELTSQIEAIKRQASILILTRFPAWKQANMTARGVELLDAKIASGALSSAEQAEDKALNTAWAWVKAVRARSDELETALNAGLGVDVKLGSIDGAGAWPGS